MLRKIIILCGPTGVGKTSLSLEIAKEIGAEIIVADSQAILKGFDIGTAKPTLGQRSEIAHHLVDVATWGEIFDAARFASLADQAIESIYSKNKIPFISGGTGLYLKALLYDLMEAPKRDEAYRRGLKQQIAEKGSPFLHHKLQEIDAKRARQIHPHDTVRIIRALELHHLTGKSPSELASVHRFGRQKYRALKIGLKLPREELCARIDKRVLKMVEEGWVEEVRGLLAQGINLLEDKTQPLGYPILARYLNQEMGLEEAIQAIQQETRRLAKRQMTWFRADKEIRWFSPEEKDEILKTIEKTPY